VNSELENVEEPLEERRQSDPSTSVQLSLVVVVPEVRESSELLDEMDSIEMDMDMDMV
jgi:hypothetical protein